VLDDVASDIRQVLPAGSRRRALGAKRIDLIHEDEAWRVEARALEEVAHAGRANAHHVAAQGETESKIEANLFSRSVHRI